jgi:predicted transposase/invertase (TIGR01784 family)
MKKNNLTQEQFAQYEAIVNEYDRFRKLSQEEKEDLIIRIATSTYIDLLCDWAFKHVFGHNEKNLMLLLNDILPEEIVHIEYDSNELDLWKGDDKKVIMDVLCHTKDGRKIIVEMQRGDKEFIRNRLLYYAAAMIYTQLAKGDSYGNLKPVYVICFMNFRTKHDTDKLIYRFGEREEEGELYNNIQNIYMCELPRFAGDSGKAGTTVEEWFDILQNMRNFASRPELYGKRYDSIFESSLQSPIPENEKLQYFRSMFDNDVRSYLTDEDRQEIAEEFFAKGVDAGKAEMAKALKELGDSDDKIARVSGLSQEEIAAL